MPKRTDHSEQLVLRVNELVHDLTSSNYIEIHDEMGGSESDRWYRNAQEFMIHDHPITVLDIGTGTGFVPLMILPQLKEHDTLIASDISTAMLESAKATIEATNPPCSTRYVKIGSTVPLSLPFEDQSVDVVTMNSVLHHIKDTEGFLDEIDRILKPGGKVFIAHEPNQHFRKNTLLKINYMLWRTILEPKLTTILALRKLRLYDIVKKLLHGASGRDGMTTTEQINNQLLREGLISTPLSSDEIATITDIRDSHGFIPSSLLTNYTALKLETYNHMLLVSIKHAENRVIRLIDGFLSRKFPSYGATFFLIAKKTGSK